MVNDNNQNNENKNYADNSNNNEDNIQEPQNQVEDNSDKVVVYFFWGDGCPHCADQKPFLEELDNKYPELEVKMYETYNNPDNVQLFKDVAKAYGTTARGVPATFVGDEFWVGYLPSIGEEIENKIKYCIQNDCINPGDKLDK